MVIHLFVDYTLVSNLARSAAMVGAGIRFGRAFLAETLLPNNRE